MFALIRTKYIICMNYTKSQGLIVKYNCRSNDILFVALLKSMRA